MSQESTRLGQLRRELRAFVDQEILPHGAAFEQSRTFPFALYARLGELGYLDMSYYHQRTDAKYNCAESMVILEEIARGLPSMALSLSPHVQCMNLIALHGTRSLRERVVPGCLSGQQLLAFAISEASGGSDALGIDTIAAPDGDGWTLNGEKHWITNADAATGYVIAAKSATDRRSRSVSLFYVDAASEGLDASERADLIGMNNSPTGVIRLKDCHVSRDCLIGVENDAYGYIKVLLNEGRLNMAALSVGIAQGAMECAIRHSSRTGRYGRNLASYQGISFPVARMYEKIFAARSTLTRVAEMFDAQERVSMEVAALKLFASEMCCEVCRDAVHIHGAKGLRQYSDIDRYFRDAQMLTIGEGSSEVCQIIISGKLYHSEPGSY